MRKGERTRREIIDRAVALASEVGLEQVTLGVLASELSLSKSGLFAHFKSKEALQLAALREVGDRFRETVVKPALRQPRGEPRLVGLFDGYLRWISAGGLPGEVRDGAVPARGQCLFMALAQEYDDRPGEVRDVLVQFQRDWRALIGGIVRTAVEAGQFRPEIDAEQFTFEFVAVMLSFQQSLKLLGDADAERRARQGFDALLARSRRER